MDCKDLARLLSEKMLIEQTPDERAQVAAHVAICRACKEEWGLDHQSQELHAVADVLRAGDSVKDAVLAKIKSEGARPCGQRPGDRSSELTAVAGYELLAEIGRGGMGVVYKARQTSMDRIVAVKILSRRLSHSETPVRRFLREARSAAKLNHPNIVQAIDAGLDQGRYYFVMEYIDGPAVAEKLRQQGALSEGEALAVTRDVAAALVHAEKHGIVHRDVKPENIMLTSDGVAKLADLGLAKGSMGDSSVTLDGHTVGTPYYMSPEQARGETDLDTRSDIYSLGATLFHMVTGVPPFDGETTGIVIAKRLTEPGPRPQDRRPELSAATSNLILRMMAPELQLRYQSARELLEDIEAALESELLTRAPTVERPAPQPDHQLTPAPVRLAANRLVLISAGVAAAVLLAVLGWLAARGLGHGHSDARPAEEGTRGPAPTVETVLVPRGDEESDPEFSGLLLECNKLAGDGRFGDAMERAGAFALDHPAMATAAERLQRDLRKQVDQRYDELERASDAALARRDYKGARDALNPVATFGVDDLAGKAREKLRQIDLQELQDIEGRAGDWVSLFDGKTLGGWKAVEQGRFAKDKVEVRNGQIVFHFGVPYAGVSWTGDFPTTDYEVALEAMRIARADTFCEITFPVGDSYCVLTVGTWDDKVALSDQVTEMTFVNGRWYPIRLLVTRDKVEAWVADRKVADLPTAGHKLALPPALEQLKPFGLDAYNCEAAVRNVMLRRLRPEP